MEFGVLGDFFGSLVIDEEVDGMILAEAKFGYELCSPFHAASYCISGDIFGFHGREGDDRLFLCDPFDRTTSEEDDTAGNGLLVEGLSIVGVGERGEYEIGESTVHVVGDTESFHALEVAEDVFYGIPVCSGRFDVELR